MNRINVESITFDENFLGLITNAAKFAVQIIANRSFIARYRLDVDELSRKRDSVHVEENSKPGFGLRASGFREPHHQGFLMHIGFVAEARRLRPEAGFV